MDSKESGAQQNQNEGKPDVEKMPGNEDETLKDTTVTKTDNDDVAMGSADSDAVDMDSRAQSKSASESASSSSGTMNDTVAANTAANSAITRQSSIIASAAAKKRLALHQTEDLPVLKATQQEPDTNRPDAGGPARKRRREVTIRTRDVSLATQQTSNTPNVSGANPGESKMLSLDGDVLPWWAVDSLDSKSRIYAAFIPCDVHSQRTQLPIVLFTPDRLMIEMNTDKLHYYVREDDPIGRIIFFY